jgi:hypothetical protein
LNIFEEIFKSFVFYFIGDHRLKAKQTGKKVKLGEIDLSDFESIGGHRNREMFN